MDKLSGKNIPDLVAEGRGKFASMPAGGSGAPAQAAPAGDSKAPAKKEEPKKEEEPEEDIDMGGLFGY